MCNSLNFESLDMDRSTLNAIQEKQTHNFINCMWAASELDSVGRNTLKKHFIYKKKIKKVLRIQNTFINEF